MEPGFAFKLANIIAACGWVFMIIFYNHPLTAKVIFSGFFVVLALFYVYFIGTAFSGGGGEGGFDTLPAVMALFKNPLAALAGWIHYLAFDMMIGLFITLNSASQGFNRFIILPVLFLTFMFGPTGLLLYFIMLCVKQKTITPQLFPVNG